MQFACLSWELAIDKTEDALAVLRDINALRQAQVVLREPPYGDRPFVRHRASPTLNHIGITTRRGMEHAGAPLPISTARLNDAASPSDNTGGIKSLGVPRV